MKKICDATRMNGIASTMPHRPFCCLKYLKKKIEPIQVVTGRFHLPPINSIKTHPARSQRRFAAKSVFPFFFIIISFKDSWWHMPEDKNRHAGTGNSRQFPEAGHLPG
jgi:hypothetical protein